MEKVTPLLIGYINQFVGEFHFLEDVIKKSNRALPVGGKVYESLSVELVLEKAAVSKSQQQELMNCPRSLLFL